MSNVKRMTQMRLGELLLREGLITKEDLDAALQMQEESGQMLGEILLDLGVITEHAIAEALANQFSLPYLSTSQCYLSRDLMDQFPVEFMRRYVLLPLDRFGNVLSVLLGGVLNEPAMKAIEEKTGCQVQAYIGTRTEILEAIDRYDADRQEAVTRNAG